jgi:rhodanese-related sulfurtransferase
VKTYQQLVQACLDSKDNPVRELLPWDLEDMLENGDPLLLDVREPEEFDAVHMNNAMNVPRGILESACDYDYEETVPELVESRGREIVVICRSGYRSVLAASVMQQMGYESVWSLKTGVKGWNDYDQPLYGKDCKELDGDEAWQIINIVLREEQKAPERRVCKPSSD